MADRSAITPRPRCLFGAIAEPYPRGKQWQLVRTATAQAQLHVTSAMEAANATMESLVIIVRAANEARAGNAVVLADVERPMRTDMDRRRQTSASRVVGDADERGFHGYGVDYVHSPLFGRARLPAVAPF